MRKFLSVIAWAIACVALIIGGIIIFSQLGETVKLLPGGFDLKTCGTMLGLGLGLFGGGIGCGIGCLASFFTAKTIDKR